MVAGPKRSLPTLAIMATFAPQRRAATAWLAPLPPKPRSNFLPKMVSPGRGKTSLKVVRSTLALPTTAMKDCLGIVANYSCVLWSVGRVCLKLRVGFNPEVAEGTEKTGRNGIYCAHGAQH